MTRYGISEILRRAIINTSPFGGELLQAGVLDERNDLFLVDLGINSIDYAEIVSNVMEEVDVEIPLKVFANTNNMREIVDLIFNMCVEPVSKNYIN